MPIRNPIGRSSFGLISAKSLFAAVCLVILALNSKESAADFLKHRRFPKNEFSNFPGYKFMGLNDIFKDELYVGYYTDRDLAETQAVAQYSQAQYVLAPRVLSVDLDKIPYRFVLLDCANREKALQKMKELNLMAVKENNVGIILARKLP